jgi:hypothetical protein
MKPACGFGLALGVFLLAAPAFAQSQTTQPAPNSAPRLPFTVRLHIDANRDYKTSFGDYVYVQGDEVSLFAGDSFGINVTVADDQIAGITYQKDPDKSDVAFKFSQESLENGKWRMQLVTRNGLKRRLAFDAQRMAPWKDEMLQTNILPIEPGLSSFESWPDPIVELVLTNFRFVDAAPAAPH